MTVESCSIGHQHHLFAPCLPLSFLDPLCTLESLYVLKPQIKGRVAADHPTPCSASLVTCLPWPISRPCPPVSLFSLSDAASSTLCIGTDLHKAVVPVCSLDGDHGSFISESPVSAQSLVPWRYPCWVNEWTMDEWGGIWISMYLIPLIHSINCKWALFLLSWSPCFRVDGRWKRKGIN